MTRPDTTLRHALRAAGSFASVVVPAAALLLLADLYPSAAIAILVCIAAVAVALAAWHETSR